MALIRGASAVHLDTRKTGRMTVQKLEWRYTTKKEARDICIYVPLVDSSSAFSVNYNV